MYSLMVRKSIKGSIFFDYLSNIGQIFEYRTNVVCRGFKSSLLSTARGFGKRASLFDRGIIPTTAIGFGKRSFPVPESRDPQEMSR